jgi:hypothetical protein
MYLIRQGFVPSIAVFGSLESSLVANAEGIGRLGNTSDDHGSLGPGTNKKCDCRRIDGNSVMRSARAVKLSTCV